jgi:alkylation response protein AidB-like acyl-CoA dehydrogenase
VIAGTGANDWLASNGEAIEVDGGYRVNAHKRFVSGGPGADLFVTSAIFDGDDGPEVIHFAVPMASAGIEIQRNWDTLGMRGTGSNDIMMQDVFVPAEAVVARRPVGTWHPMWDVIVPVALPIIVSCYVGLAESAATYATFLLRGARRIRCDLRYAKRVRQIPPGSGDRRNADRDCHCADGARRHDPHRG